MTKTFKHLLSILLAVLFLTPMTIQLFDGVFHHHDHNIFSTNPKQNIHEYHEKCPIPGYEFSIFEIQKQVLNTQKISYGHPVSFSFISNFRPNNSDYSFLLRAPPQGLI